MPAKLMYVMLSSPSKVGMSLRLFWSQKLAHGLGTGRLKLRTCPSLVTGIAGDCDVKYGFGKPSTLQLIAATAMANCGPADASQSLLLIVIFAFAPPCK